MKEIWAVLERDGMDASIAALLERCDPDVELRPYSAAGRTLHGVGEIRAFVRERAADGGSVHVSPFSFEERDDVVVVTGSIRVTRGDGSIADAQLRWSYAFRGELISRAEFAPLTAGVAR